ncbi:MAG: hypothetical protein FWC32_01540 [Firmicutes bacterium]|nr:hypothetical protein [Bacillota bacterium]
MSQGSVVGATSSQVTSGNMMIIGTPFFGFGFGFGFVFVLAAACPVQRTLDTGGSGGGGKSPPRRNKIILRVSGEPATSNGATNPTHFSNICG